MLYVFFFARSATILFFSFSSFFNDTATPEIYTLSLHDALPIWPPRTSPSRCCSAAPSSCSRLASHTSSRTRVLPSSRDRKSTRLNSSHRCISYAVFCLKKKKNQKNKEVNIKKK